MNRRRSKTRAKPRHHLTLKRKGGSDQQPRSDDRAKLQLEALESRNLWSNADLDRLQILYALDGHEREVEQPHSADDPTEYDSADSMSVGARWGLSGDYEVVYELVQPPVQSFAAASFEALMQGPRPGSAAADLFESIPKDEEPDEDRAATALDESPGGATRSEQVVTSADYGSSDAARTEHQVVAVESIASKAAVASGGFFAQLLSLLRGFGGKSRSGEQGDKAPKSGRVHPSQQSGNGAENRAT